MSRPTLHLPKGKLDLFSSAPAGANRAAANPAAVTSLTAEARRQDGGQGPASERESAIHTARVLIGEASRRRAQHAFHAWLLRAAANQRRRAAGSAHHRETGQLDLFGGAPQYPDPREPAMSAEDRASMSERERAYQAVQ